MTAKSKSESFDDVFRRELQEILKRRREANLKVEADEAGNPRSPEDSLVGLALSGGGVRSAAFNLGLLQALHEHDVLRHIDYMSTVSGGGYVGASLSSLALHPQTDFGFKTKHHETTVGQESVLNDRSRGTGLGTDPWGRVSPPAVDFFEPLLDRRDPDQYRRAEYGFRFGRIDRMDVSMA
jgi:hypothetical protein